MRQILAKFLGENLFNMTLVPDVLKIQFRRNSYILLYVPR
jgi:hypothetical protein